MTGHVELHFKPEDLGIDPEALPRRPDAGTRTANFCDALAELLRNTPLNIFETSGDIDDNGRVTCARGMIIARLPFGIDPRNRTLIVETLVGDVKPSVVMLYFLVNVVSRVDSSGAPRELLRCGIWNNAEKTVGVVIANLPDKDNPNQVMIYVSASTLAEARNALFDTLSGKQHPDPAWII